MSGGKREDEWDRTSPIMSFMFNHWRDPEKSREVALDHWSPFRKGPRHHVGGVPLTPALLHSFKDILPHSKPKA